MVASPWKEKRASSGSSTWKLNDSVPTAAISASGIASSGVRRTYASASRSAPGLRGTGAVAWRSCGSIRRRANSIARKVSALMRKQGATPQVAITTPAIAGPAMRAVCTSTLLRPTALTTRSEPTISITKLWRVGLSRALTVPRASTSANTIHSSTEPVAASAQRASAGSAIAAWVSIRMRRLGKRSASRPPNAPSTRIGANWRQAVMPTARPLPVSLSTSQVSATICIQLPLSDTTWPAK